METVTKQYFGCIVTVSHNGLEWHSLPWTFTVKSGDSTYTFYGIPNKCSTVRQALRRAWWRAKWISEGTFEKHYNS